MKIEKSERIDIICPKHDVRSYLNAPYLDRENGALVATDGHALAAVDLAELELNADDVTGPVPIEALAAARKAASAKNAVNLKLNGGAKFETINGATMEFSRGDNDRRFPDWQRIMPSKDRPSVAVGFNAELLAKLSQALGNPMVELRIAVDQSVSRPYMRDGQRPRELPELATALQALAESYAEGTHRAELLGIAAELRATVVTLAVDACVPFEVRPLSGAKRETRRGVLMPCRLP